MLQENLPLNVFLSMKTLQKEINIYFPWPMKKQKKFNWKYIWTNNRRILLRQSNDSRVIAIRSEKDIERIKNPMVNPRNPN